MTLERIQKFYDSEEYLRYDRAEIPHKLIKKVRAFEDRRILLSFDEEHIAKNEEWLYNSDEDDEAEYSELIIVASMISLFKDPRNNSDLYDSESFEEGQCIVMDLRQKEAPICFFYDDEVIPVAPDLDTFLTMIRK